METTRKIFPLVVAFLLLLACLPQAVLAEEPNSVPRDVSINIDYLGGADDRLIIEVTNHDGTYAEAPYELGLTVNGDPVWKEEVRDNIEWEFIPTFSEFLVPGENTVVVKVSDMSTSIYYDPDLSNNEDTEMIFIRSDESVLDIKAGAGIFNYGKSLYVGASLPGEYCPEGPFIYTVYFNGEEIYEKEELSDYRLLIDIRDRTFIGFNTYSVMVTKDGVFDPDLENNVKEASLNIVKNNTPQDIGISTSYDKISDILTVCPVPISEEDPYVPRLFHVKINIEGEEILSADFDLSQGGCVIEDFSSYLNPGDNKVTVEISYVDWSPLFDPNPGDNKETFAVMAPATCASVSGVDTKKGIAQEATIYISLEGNSPIAKRVVIEIYDKKGNFLSRGEFSDLEFPCTVTMTSNEYGFLWSNVAGGCSAIALVEK